MKKNISEEAFKARVQHLAGVKNDAVNESKNRTLGTLIDFERAANGVAYGIVKEQHKYYIKKGGLNENLTVADFAYIGGLENITDYQYSKLSEAEKNRNMLLKTVNEGHEMKVSKTGSKKEVLTEDKAGEEIEMAASKVDDLEDATAAADAPAEPVPAPPVEEPLADDGGEAEMAAGIEAMPADDVAPEGGEEVAVDAEVSAGEDGVADDAEVAADGEIEAGEEEVAVEDPQSEATREIEKDLGKLTNKLRKTELTEPQVKSYVNSFLSAFKDDFPEIDIEDRKEMAEKITKVVPDTEIEDLGQNVEDTEVDTEITATEPAEEPALEEKEECSECGTFAKYAESRGYTAESIRECGEEEMTNLISGYANAHGEGQNDGDFKAIALFISPEIIEKLKGEYGHDEFAGQIEPVEMSDDEKTIEINELFGGLSALGKAAGAGIKKGAQQVGQAVADKASQVKQGVQQAATNVKQTYHAGELPKEVKKLEKQAADLGAQIGALNKRMQKAGGQPINVASILTTIKNQMSAGGAANLGKFGSVQEGESIAVEEPVDGTGIEKPVNEEGSIAVEEPIDNTGVEKPVDNPPSPDKEPIVVEGDSIAVEEPVDGTGIEKPVNEEVPADHVESQPPMEEDVEIKVSEKEGKKLSADNTPEVEMKEDVQIAAGFEPMGGGVAKPEGAPIEMSESEQKLRTYIRNRLEEMAGIKKPSLNESKKSEKLQKLDKLIEKQFKLYESEAKENLDESINEILGLSVREKFAKLNPQDEQGVENVFKQAFKEILVNPKMGAIARAAQTTPTEMKYNILQQYVEQGGGTLRLGSDVNTVEFAGKDVKSAATPSKFSGGGTQGQTRFGGVTGG